jgi:hypothetical protein
MISINQPYFYNYTQWCEKYNDELIDCYNKLIEYCENNCETIFDKLDFDTFTDFIYYHSTPDREKY